MRPLSQSSIAILFVGLCCAAGCSYTPKLYCDENKPCTDPSRPFCDLEGTYPASEGIGHTCIPDPSDVDAGVDASVADADTSTDGSSSDGAPITHTVTLINAGTGNGTVVSNPFGINCGSACSAEFAEGTTVTLTATAENDSYVALMSGGGCTYDGIDQCELVVAADVTVTVTFDLKEYDLTITLAGDGTGAVTGPPGIGCSTDDPTTGCTGTYTHGTAISLTAAPAGVSTFGGWSGDCSGLDPDGCSFTMDSHKSVGAAFDLDKFTLSVSVTGPGTVTSGDGLINCPGDCSESYDAGTYVVLTESHDSALTTFDGWSGGGCNGSGQTCGVTVNASTSVQATFSAIMYDLVLTKTSTQSGDGLVSSTPSGITCGPGCTGDTASFAAGTPVALTAIPDGSSAFQGWTGSGCSTGTECNITMDSAKLVDAEFCSPRVCGANECEVVSDGCGSSIDCGDCPGEFNTCGGGGTPNVCYSSNTHSIDLEQDSSESAGITDAAQESNGGVLDLTGDFTFEMWAKFESPLPGFPSTWVFLSKHQSGGGDFRSYRWWFQNLGSPNPDYYIGINISQTGAAEDRVTWPFTPTTGTWYHLAVTCDVSLPVATEFELFIDGVSQGNGHVDSDANVTAIYDGPAPFKIGSLYADGWSFDGKIDDVRVWAGVLTASEIANNRNVELEGAMPGLAGYWKLNNDYTDSSGSGNDLTPSGTPEFTTDVP